MTESTNGTNAEMTEAELDRLGMLLARARGTPPTAREALLESHPRDDALHDEVTSLLAADAYAAAFFEMFASAVTVQAVDRLRHASPSRVDGDPLGLEGTRVGRYRVDHYLGGGGMGIVYRADDAELGRTVALKFLSPHLTASKEARKRLIQEAKAAASLDHPNIATVYEISASDDGQPFIVMGYYEGETLKRKIERGRLAVDEALNYAAQLAEGLARGHEAGIVHRDVKPANVIVTLRAEVKIVDFGLARVAGNAHLTRSGVPIGTVAYMSPEQVVGDRVDLRTDVWAFGATLYEMLTGERPFKGEHHVSVMHAILHQDPLDISDLRGDVPSEIAAIVNRSMCKNPDERYASAVVIAEALRSLHHKASPEYVPHVRLPFRRSGRAWSMKIAVPLTPIHRWMALGGALLLAFAAISFSWFVTSERDTALGASSAQPRSIAVLPFAVTGLGAETWREGMVTVLSTGLDGVSGLRAVADRTILSAWQRTDSSRLSAGNELPVIVARSVGARYAVVGSAVVMGQELRLTAYVYDTASGHRLGSAQVQGSPNGIMDLADALTRRIIGLLLERSDEAIPSINLKSITTSSLPALKAFLEGERRFRAGEYEAAIRDFEAAILEDSLFALAHARLVPARAWSNNPGVLESLRRAYALSRQLPKRERGLIAAMYTRYVLRDPLAAADSLRRLSEAYPDDPAVWFERGETIYHGYIPEGRPEAERAFQHAVRLDPGVVQYHSHLVDLAFAFHRDSKLAASRVDAHPGNLARESNRLSLDLVFGSGDERRTALARLDTLQPPFQGFPFGGLLANLYHPLDRALQEEVVRAILKREDLDSRILHRYLAIVQLHRGRIGDALSALQRGASPEIADAGCLLAGSLSLGYTLPDAVLRPLLDPSRLPAPVSTGRMLCAGIYLIEQGRSDELPPLFATLTALGGDEPVERIIAERKVDELRGYQAWKDGDVEEAAHFWKRSYQLGAPGAIWRGDLYRDLGQFDRAEGWYQSAWDHPVAHERLGRLYEAMGRTAEAAAAFERFVAAWADADSALQDRVLTARARLRR